MTEVEVYILSDQALVAVVDQIKDEQWALPIPESFGPGRSHEGETVTLKTIINDHAYDDAWVPDVLAGKTAAEVGDKYDGDLLGDDPKVSFRAIADKGIAAAKAVTDPDKIVHLSYGDWPAKEYFKHITSFRGFRAYDIAKLIGASTKLPDDLVQGMWDEISPEVENWRKMGVFPAPIEVPEDAPLQDRLLGMCGRNPH